MGLALSDPLRVIASPLCVLHFTTEQALVEELLARCRRHAASTVVVGAPQTTEDEPTELGRRAYRVVSKIRRAGIGADTWAEEFSTRDARSALGKRARGARGKHSGAIDRVAAAVILQDYIEHHGTLSRPP